MTTWASEMSPYRDSDNQVIGNVKRYVFDVVTDNDGQFFVDLSPLNISEVIEVSSYLVGQIITPATDIVNVLNSRVIGVSNTSITGVIFKGNSITIALGVLFKSLIRGPAGITVKVTIVAR